MKTFFLLLFICLMASTQASAQGASIAANDVSHAVLIIETGDDSTALQAYAGTYILKDNPYVDEINLSIKNGQLMSITPENEEVILQPTEEKDTFFVSMINAKIVFRRQNNAVVGMKAVVQGKAMEGTKKI